MQITNNKYISNETYSNFISTSRYARWIPEENRRETWHETVTRYIDFWIARGQLTKENSVELFDAIFNLEVMPSMRCLMTAGAALDANNIAGYNCAYTEIDEVSTFSEVMEVLMCGTGVGFSCERQNIANLPEIAETIKDIIGQQIVVEDSKDGWAAAYKELITSLYSGHARSWDVSKVRKAGEPLKTFGGRASGPAPLVELFEYTVNVFKNAEGRKLDSLEVHGLICKIAEIVVVGGVRRSALISLSNLSDDRMRNAKSGQWWSNNPEFALANNSVAYTEKPDSTRFLKEWISLIESKAGERGIFNREACNIIVDKIGRRDSNHQFGTNPCSEIILRNKQFCNLSEVVVRFDDTEESLMRKVRLATILGTLQSTLTDFKNLSEKWTFNTAEERLLGVSLTGIMDNTLTSTNGTALKYLLNKLRDRSVEVNKEWAEILDIPRSTAITCVKPSGTVSQLVNSASGMHARFSEHYLRTVRCDKKDPIHSLLKANGVYAEDDVMKPENTTVFYFPIKSPKGSIYQKELTAIEQLELWLTYQDEWCEHKPSVTVYVKDEEWIDVANWVYKHFDKISGISFLPHSDSVYQQAPYQEISKEEYVEWEKKTPKHIPWEDLGKYEKTDHTAGAKTMSCTGTTCELVDLTS